MTFSEIEIAAQGADREVYNLVASALENANDTVYVEKARPESELYEVAMATLIENLSFYTGPRATLDWFADRGVSW